MASLKYSYPWGLFSALVRDILLLRRRDFHKDAKACIENLSAPLKISGSENIPQRGPCVITVNHYHREGFGAQWLALAVAACVPVNMQWIMTGEFMYEGKWYETIGAMSSRILLKRIARVYGFFNMPPMPPRAKDVAQRAAAVRAVLQFVKIAQTPIVGLAPEGHDRPDGALTRPARGVGRFGLLLSRAGLKFIPVGAHEADGVFQIHFGKPYTLNIPYDLSPDERDAQASQVMMENIARLLPMHLRGDFA